AITYNNMRRFLRLQAPANGSADATAPCVSILIPARNEAAVIGESVQLLSAQGYSQREIIVLDDNSEDGTGSIAQQAAGDVRVLTGSPLPAGWMGKNWACHQLAQHAQGDILLFTDADVRWQPGALAAVVDLFERTEADLLTVWPTQITVSWGERLTVPLIAMTVLAYLPVQLAHDFYHPLAAAANGQC
ncbi:MAG: glycosyltransferase, partial [Anaerolineales bacterium]|nr:glycosyltransferase [Anaerolineales bacterium]